MATPYTSFGLPPSTAAYYSQQGPFSTQQIPEGKYTQTVYTAIRDGKYEAVIKMLENEIQNAEARRVGTGGTPAGSRAAWSLMGFAMYRMQDWVGAAECYEKLVWLHPDVDEYRLYFAQCLYKSAQYAQAQKTCLTIENPEYISKVTKLQAAIKYESSDLVGCKVLVEQGSRDDPDTIVNQGCLLYKDGLYDEAIQKYNEAIKLTGYKAELSYNVALCHYRLKQTIPALKHIADIIEKGIREHPELNVGMTTEGMEVRSVGNSQALHQTYLIEAFNLKAAIEFQMKNFEAAKEALTDMPPRLESELDQVTLHNQALMNMERDPSGGFEKLGFLLQQVPTPPETFGNLALLYVKYEYYDLAADLMAENQHLALDALGQELYDFIDAILLKQSSSEEAYKKFDDMASKHVEVLRKYTKQVQEARQNHEEDAVKKVVTEYDEAVGRYIPVLMAQAKIYWDMENYAMVEKIFRKSVEFCNEQDAWKLNVAHVLFMQESKFKEAISFYEPIVKKNYDSILDVTAIVLANLCVSYIMTSQNEDAEELMRRIEKEEERVAYEDPQKRTYHLCIVNLVIGTLYCAKGNFEFGISRIMKSLEPFNKKLSTDTWYYAKRCFVALFETLAKHMILLRDGVISEILAFFDSCEAHGKKIPAVLDPLMAGRDFMSNSNGGIMDGMRNLVSYEARRMKCLYLRLVTD